MRYNVVMLKRVKELIRGAVALLTAALIIALPLHAAPYGEGNYNNCTYACAVSSKTPAPQTSIVLSSGLTVTINLTNGQKIPPDGYVVVVQPASDQTGKLQSADFFVNGNRQFSGTPNDVGAIRWLWQPNGLSGDVRVKIAITAQGGATTSQEFTVTIGTPDAPATTEQSNDVVSNVSRAVLSFVGTLPMPVLYGLPYFLFAILLLNIVLLLVQTQRELREIAILRRIISIERNTGLEKNVFVTLASHYLRTPISIMQGGLDLLLTARKIPPQTAESAKQIIDTMRTKVETLLARSEASSQIAGIPESDIPLPSIWKNPGLYLPILLIGLFALAFNYITANVESFSTNQLNLFLQVVIFALLAVVFYQSFRRRQLRRRDNKGMQQALAHEQAINQSRDELISESATMLSGDTQQLRNIMESLPPTEEKEYVRDGMIRFKSVLTKFAIAGQLRGSRSTRPGSPVSLDNMLAHLPLSLTQQLSAKGVALQPQNDVTFTVSNAQLVLYVLASLIDNAREYSPAHSTITVQASSGGTGTTISVIDHGPGISPQKISQLFQPFSRTQDVERFTHEGMGFSLYLDKLIMTHLGGSIAITSKPGQTTATITLPA